MGDHTKGPWEAYNQRRDDGSEYGFVVRSTTDEDADWICEVNGNFEQDEANARLSAAAPDLLLSLIDVMDSLRLRDKDGRMGPSHIGPVYDNARAAIAKAKGE